MPHTGRDGAARLPGKVLVPPWYVKYLFSSGGIMIKPIAWGRFKTSNLLANPGVLFVFLLVLAVQAFAGQASLAWTDGDSTVAGYMLSYGQISGSYTSTVDVGNQTGYTISGLLEGKTYYYAATAYDASRTQSPYSNEATSTIPYAPPSASFNANIKSGVAPLTVTFSSTSTGTITGYSCPFGDTISPALLANPSHTYAAPGTYSVSLTVTGPGGANTQTQAGLIVVSPVPPPPVAGFSASPQSGMAPRPVVFSNSSTGSITTYAWTFGDGTGSALALPTHSYTVAGTYSVSLTVTGPGGTNAQTQTGLIVVSAAPPVAGFAAPTQSGPAPFSVSFSDSSTGSITSYAWNFGDGTSSAAALPVHSYAVPGNYSVSLTVTGAGGTNTMTRNGYITASVALPPPASTSLWASTVVPAIPAASDPNPVELGVKFRSDIGGTIKGIRFYKGRSDTGTYSGSLRSSTGALLGRATLTATASGWQQVNFATPIAILANTIYVASYHTSSGYYAFTSEFFAKAGVDNAPLHALAGTNGVFKYGTSPGFPNATYQSSNYWVDVQFVPN